MRKKLRSNDDVINRYVDEFDEETNKSHYTEANRCCNCYLLKLCN